LAEPSFSDKEDLAAAVANSTGVALASVRDFTVESSPITRRLDSTSEAVRRLTGYTWAVSFSIVVSLAATSSATSTEFANYVTDVLNDASFKAAVLAAIPSATGVSEVTAVDKTLAVDDTADGDSSGIMDNKSTFTFIYAGAGFAGLGIFAALIACAVVSADKKRKAASKAATDDTDKVSVDVEAPKLEEDKKAEEAAAKVKSTAAPESSELKKPASSDPSATKPGLTKPGSTKPGPRSPKARSAPSSRSGSSFSAQQNDSTL